MTSVRWTAEQLADYRTRRSAPAEQRAKPIERRVVLAQPSLLERKLDQQIIEAGLPEPRRNWFLLKERNLELDRAWPTQKIAVEVQGMAHRIKGKFQRDIEKRALAMLAGWRVLEVDGASIRSGKAIEWLKQLLAA